MAKWILTVLVALLMIPLATATTDCAGIMNKRDLPCLVISSWSFDCDRYSVKIFNETPSLLRNASLADYGETSRCNLVFGNATNETVIGSYLLNWSTGDSSKIIIQKEDNMIAITIGLIFVMIFFAVFGFVFDSWGAKLFGYGVALIQLLNIVYIMYINELNQSLAPILRINFISILWLAFGIGLIGMIRISISLISMGEGADTPEEDKKWGRS